MVGLASSAKVSKRKFVGLTPGFWVKLKIGSYSLNKVLTYSHQTYCNILIVTFIYKLLLYYFYDF